ncbi:helicase protein MOM1 [Trifolium repens]|nr:helicase protein MOM1 [Trifolium repens]
MSPVKRIRRNLSSSSNDLKKKITKRNHSPSTSRTLVSNQQDSVRHVSNMFMSRAGNLWSSKKPRTLRKTRTLHKTRTLRIEVEDKDCNEDSNSTDSLTRGNSNMVGGKVDECLKGNNSLDCNAVSKDCILPSEDANVRAESTSTTHVETSRILERVQSDSYREETSQECVGNDKGENWTPKRKSTVTDKCSDVTATLVYSSRCSKRIRRTSNVDQPTSKSTDEKSCARIMEDSGRPQGNNVEDEKKRSQHLSLKLELAKLCEILLLPDNVKSKVGKILEYNMNNIQICAETVTTRLQAFQLSLCFYAASFLKHKLDIEASLILAKKHLNFDCKKNEVDKINSMLWGLRENSKVTSSPMAFESSTSFHSNTDIIPYVESIETQKPMEKATSNERQKRKTQWRKLLQMQLENKNKLKKDIETKEADLVIRYKIELGAYKKYYVMTKEMLKDYKAEYYRKLAELKRQHEVRLQAFETKKLEARKKFRESWTLDEVLEDAAEPNQYSNHVSMVTEPIEKMQQLSSSRILSSNKDFSSEDAIFKELQAKSNFEKEMKKINAKFQEERKKTMLAKSNPEFPGASRMLHLQASRNLQAGGEASHIPPYGPSTFIPASGVSGILHGMPRHHPSTPSSHINSISSVSRNLQAGVEIRTPAPHLYLPRLPSRFIPILPPTTISKVGTHRWHGQENIGLSPHAHTLSFKDMHMNPN